MKKITLLVALLVATFTMNAQTTLFSTDFSSGDLSDFDQVINSASAENFAVITVGSHDTAASVAFDPALVPQDEQLITPALDLTNFETAEVEFNWFASYFWSVDPNENYDINVLVSTDGGVTFTEIWDETQGQQFESSDENFLWLEERTTPAPLEVVSLNDYVGMSDVRIAFQYLGVDGAQGAFDDITIRGEESLSTDEFSTTNFTQFYNVDSDELRLSASVPMQSLKIFNTLGQEVVNRTLSNTEEAVNLSTMSNGIYVAQVAIGNSTKAFKIIKR